MITKNMPYLNLVKQFWNEVYDTKKDATEIIKQFFHPDYEQCINGVILHRDEYVNHVLAQRKNMLIDSFDFKHALEQGDELFVLYYVKGKNKSGDPIEAEVISYYHFINQQIDRIHGQGRLIKGDLADADMKQ